MSVPLITELPVAPQRTDTPAVFSDRADAFVGALSLFRSEANALGTWVQNRAVDVDNAVNAALGYRNNASTSATNASNSASTASTSATNASNSAQLAKDWAEKTTAVEPGKYSAKYWATEAESVIIGTIIDDNSTGSTRTWSAQKLMATFLPLTSSSVANWNAAYGWGNHASAGYALGARTITAGTGLTGGGNLTANRTLAVNFGTASGTVAQGNDSRINNGQTAFSWGNHALAGYVTAANTPQINNSVSTAGSYGAGTTNSTLDLGTNLFHIISFSGTGTHNVTFNNIPDTTNKYISWHVMVNRAGLKTINFGSVDWAGGTQPTGLSTSAGTFALFMFYRVNNGTIRGMLVDVS